MPAPTYRLNVEGIDVASLHRVYATKLLAIENARTAFPNQLTKNNTQGVAFVSWREEAKITIHRNY